MSQAFGRRAPAQAPKAPLPVPAKFSRPSSGAAKIEPAPPSVDDELQEWKKSRRRNFPVKLLALMASLCFGIASVALPKEISHDEVQWPLYALSAASLYHAGFRRKTGKVPGK